MDVARFDVLIIAQASYGCLHRDSRRISWEHVTKFIQVKAFAGRSW
jgi:hypothetical protein